MVFENIDVGIVNTVLCSIKSYNDVYFKFYLKHRNIKWKYVVLSFAIVSNFRHPWSMIWRLVLTVK